MRDMTSECYDVVADKGAYKSVINTQLYFIRVHQLADTPVCHSAFVAKWPSPLMSTSVDT